jgi:hypothetical protein
MKNHRKGRDSIDGLFYFSINPLVDYSIDRLFD